MTFSRRAAASRLLAAVGVLATALVAAPAAGASAGGSTDFAITSTAAARTTVLGSTFRVSSRFTVTCPQAGTDPCEVTTAAYTRERTAGGGIRLVDAGTGSTRLDPGGRGRIVVRLNAAGAAALRARGALRLSLSITADDGVYGALYDVVQSVRIPARQVSDASSGRTVTLTHGQRLVVVLRGESASTGSRWTVARLAAGSTLRRLSERIVASPCPTGNTGCSASRVVTFAPVGTGTAQVSAVLGGPAGSVVRRFRLAVGAQG
ncbi:MAG: hypothetical protein JWM98_1124 [Thermoleophilia bacterium]|nr:hypothetical protein [Thermoleophilia bacterium]